MIFLVNFSCKAFNSAIYCSKITDFSKNLSFLLLFFCSIHTLFTPSADAKPCYPSDPDYTNPGNLCPAFPPGSVSADSFRQGEGRPVRELPTLSNPAGKVILSPSGFWTGSESNGNFRTLRTNNGQIFLIPRN